MEDENAELHGEGRCLHNFSGKKYGRAFGTLSTAFEFLGSCVKGCSVFLGNATGTAAAAAEALRTKSCRPGGRSDLSPLGVAVLALRILQAQKKGAPKKYLMLEPLADAFAALCSHQKLAQDAKGRRVAFAASRLRTTHGGARVCRAYSTRRLCRRSGAASSCRNVQVSW